MLEVVQTRGSSWVDYMWPKPGESISTQKSAYVAKAKMGDQWVLVGSGVYLADAPKVAPATKPMTAPQLMTLVRMELQFLKNTASRLTPSSVSMDPDGSGMIPISLSSRWTAPEYSMPKNRLARDGMTAA